MNLNSVLGALKESFKCSDDNTRAVLMSISLNRISVFSPSDAEEPGNNADCIITSSSPYFPPIQSSSSIKMGIKNQLDAAALIASTTTAIPRPPPIFPYDDEDGSNEHRNMIHQANNPMKRLRKDNSQQPVLPPTFVSAKDKFFQQQQVPRMGLHKSASIDDEECPPPPPPQQQPFVRAFKPPSMERVNKTLGSNPAIRKPSFNVKQAIQKQSPPPEETEEVDPRLKGIDPELIERIENEILESGETVSFSDIAGLEFAKQCIQEIVVWPMRNPELYTGLRQMPRGLLLFGPPGNGKTVIGKAIAHECAATFFSISASSLTSKWIGEGEKTMRALFAVAAVRQPSVVFIDEIDSLLTQRSAEENEASRRLKTEFLVQFDGTGTKESDRILIIGATNRPQELDEAARRRFVRRLYIPLPDANTRTALLNHLLKKNDHVLSDEEVCELGNKYTLGYSGADTTNLAREASMGPLREEMRARIDGAKERPLRPISRKDFDVALRSVKASVSSNDLKEFDEWNQQFGTQQLGE